MSQKSVSIRKFFQGKKLKIFTAASLTGGTNLNEWVDLVDEDTRIFFFDQNYVANQSAGFYREVFSRVDSNRFYFFSSSVRTHENRLRAGLRSWLISNNILVNEKVFYDEDLDVKYDALVVARDMALKRIGLAGAVSDLAMVIDRWHNSQFHPPVGEWQEMRHSYLNNRKLSPDELRKLYSSSNATLVFSEEEGACFTVAESLLCGTPVVSNAPSQTDLPTVGTLGGRELYLDSRNSAYLESLNPLAVAEAVEKCKRVPFDRKSIRENIVNFNNRQREFLAKEILQPLLDQFSESCSAFDLLFKNSFLANGQGRHRLSCDGNLVPLSLLSQYLAASGTFERQVIGVTTDKEDKLEALFDEEINQRIDRLWIRKKYFPNLRGRDLLYCGVAGYSKNYPRLTSLNFTSIDIDAKQKKFGSDFRHIIGDVQTLREEFDHVSFYGLLGHSSASFSTSADGIHALHTHLSSLVRPGGSLLLGHQGLNWGEALGACSALKTYRVLQDSVPGVTSNYIWWGVKPAKVFVFVAHPDDCMLFAYPFIFKNTNFKFEICYLTGHGPRLENCRNFWGDLSINVRSLGFPDSPTDLKSGRSSISDDQVQRGLETVLKSEAFDFILTHSPDGEYGHPHHVQANRIARNLGKTVISFSHHRKDLASFAVKIKNSELRVRKEKLIDTHRQALQHYDERFGVWSEGFYFVRDGFPYVHELE